VARGWESKSIESQQDDARSTWGGSDAPSDTDPARRVVVLARARVAADLERATHPAHRRMLEQALAKLDAALQNALPLDGGKARPR
jgi:hypothetical protein